MQDYLASSTLYFIDRSLFLFSAFIGSAILFINFYNIKLKVKTILYILITSIIIPLFCQMLGGINNYTIIKLIYIVLMCVLLAILNYKNFYSSIPTAIVSVAITLCIQYIGVFITSAILFLLNLTDYKLLATIMDCVFQLAFCMILSKSKWLKKCFSYLTKEQNEGIGLLISSYIFLFSLLLSQQISIDINFGIILFAFLPLALTGLILWIKSIVDRYYKRKIANRADQFTQQELADKDAYIQKLESEVATLAKQLHRDNHLLSSLERSAQILVTTDSAKEREQLVDEIHTLYRERNDMIAQDHQANKILPSTGIAIIDGALSEMYVKATAHHISFDLMVGEELHYLVNNYISQTDLQTLLCDHIKDAIIAIDTADNVNGKILVTIEKNEGIFEISIRDNGIDFEPETLAKLGTECVTTHADSGGSGIGFITTFETLAKTKCSLIITEYKNRSPYSKAVSFYFDGLHRFIISSYRKDELKQVLSRDDVVIL